MIRLYTPEEDKIITTCVQQALANGEPAIKGIKMAAQTIKEKCGIERTFKGIYYRWSHLQQKNSVNQRPAQKNQHCTNGADYVPEEDAIIKEHILEAVLRERKTITEGAKKAAEEIEARLGKKRTTGAVASRWHRWIKHRLPEDVKKDIHIVARELSSMRLKKDKKELSATDIVNVAEKYNRNPLHVLGVCGNLPGQETFTVGHILQLINENERLRKQVAALKNLNKNLLAQLISANRYRSEILKNNLKQSDGRLTGTYSPFRMGVRDGDEYVRNPLYTRSASPEARR